MSSVAAIILSSVIYAPEKQKKSQTHSTSATSP